MACAALGLDERAAAGFPDAGYTERVEYQLTGGLEPLRTNDLSRLPPRHRRGPAGCPGLRATALGPDLARWLRAGQDAAVLPAGPAVERGGDARNRVDRGPVTGTARACPPRGWAVHKPPHHQPGGSALLRLGQCGPRPAVRRTTEHHLARALPAAHRRRDRAHAPPPGAPPRPHRPPFRWTSKAPASSWPPTGRPSATSFRWPQKSATTTPVFDIWSSTVRAWTTSTCWKTSASDGFTVRRMLRSATHPAALGTCRNFLPWLPVIFACRTAAPVTAY